MYPYSSDVEQVLSKRSPSTYKVLLGVFMFAAGLALILSIVSIVLYSTVSQPVKPKLRSMSLEAKTTNPVFTPVNFVYFVTTAPSADCGVSAGRLTSSGNIGTFYAIYNSSPYNISFYNAGESTIIATIMPYTAKTFIVGGLGKSIPVE